MKTLISILFVMMIVGCGKIKTEITEKPLSPEENLVGSYEAKSAEVNTFKLALLENGKGETYVNGKKVKTYEKWKTLGNEVHVNDITGVMIFRIESNGNLTSVGKIVDGKREEEPIETTWNKSNSSLP